MNAESTEEPAKKPAGCGMGCLVIVGIIVLISVIVGIATAITPKKPYDANNKYEAIAACESQVKDRLKAPSTAKFSDEDATGYGTWTVTGNVDSENSFGAALRASFQCTVIIKGDTTRTRVDSLG